jgi:hypothetical protein
MTSLIAVEEEDPFFPTDFHSFVSRREILENELVPETHTGVEALV